MLRVYLSLTSTTRPATDLGYLLHKHPDRAQSVEVTAGQAHVFYPEASDERCTVALLVEADPVALARGRHGHQQGHLLGQYVNHRPYAASSMLAVALGKAFRTALAGRCDARPELVDVPLDLEVHVPALPADGDPAFVRALFEPLGWTVTATPVALDETVPGWGASRYVDLRLTGPHVLAHALSHLYVLLPVLDGGKHYWVSDQEIDKLVRAGGDWLATHPLRETILRRALAHQRRLVDDATARLTELDGQPLPDETADDSDGDTRPLVALRREAVLAAVKLSGAHSVVDVGCGEGSLLRALLEDPDYTDVLGVDVSARALDTAERRLHLATMNGRQRERIRLLQSSVTYRDDRLRSFDAMVLMEVVEHLDAPRLPALEDTVFGHARPGTVVLTTPNAEHNVRYPRLAAGAMRHLDHRFEWTRAELHAWADAVADRHGYAVTYAPIGADDPEVGPPTQLAVFTRHERAS
jgi:3' terminal RNA ribose 2'-O-methyltransferase Hen1